MGTTCGAAVGPTNEEHLPPLRLENFIGDERDAARHFFLAQRRHCVQRDPQAGRFLLASGARRRMRFGLAPRVGVEFAENVRLPIRFRLS